MTKKILLSVVMLIGSAFVGISQASESYGCERKLLALEKQLGYAEQYNNQHRILGLKRAIANVKQYCGKGTKGKFRAETDVGVDAQRGKSKRSQFLDDAE